MAVPQSRQDLVDYALRTLGEPIIKVNVTDEQISDRLDDTLLKFKDFHYNGQMRVYVQHQVTDDDITNKYIPVPTNIIEIVRVLPYVSASIATGTVGDANLFSAQYQMRFTDLWNMTTGSALYYELTMQNLSQMDILFNGRPIMRHIQVIDKLYLDAPWGTVLKAGNWLTFECLVTADPEEYKKIYAQSWVKHYFTAQVKKQWGANIKKFGGISLIGGVTLNGNAIFDEAVGEIQALEEELRNVWEAPCNFIMG